MMAVWDPAETEAEDTPAPAVERWAPGAALTVIVMLSAGGWSLLWFLASAAGWRP